MKRQLEAEYATQRNIIKWKEQLTRPKPQPQPQKPSIVDRLIKKEQEAILTRIKRQIETENRLPPGILDDQPTHASETTKY